MRVKLLGCALLCVTAGAGSLLSATNHGGPALTRDLIASSGDRVFLSGPQGNEAASRGLLPKGARSVLNPHRRLHHGEFVWDDEGIAPGRVDVRVDLRTQVISVFRGGHEIGAAVILFGAQSHDTPLGRLPILSKLRDHSSSIYDAPMPFTLRLTEDGVSIHGSDVRTGLGTHGCVGVPREFAALLYDEVRVGDVVEIVRTRAFDT